jgi:outer membrane protein assembly factor BamB
VIFPRRRVAAGVAVVIIGLGGVAGLGLVRGWFDEGSREGSTQGFDPTAEPRAPADLGTWPEYGLDGQRTRANTALTNLRPPFREAWTFDAGSLVEFPPVVGRGRIILGTNAGRAIGLDQRTGRRVWSRRLVGQVASSPALAGERALFTTTRGRLVALDVRTGAPRGSIDLGAPSESSPLVVDDSVYVGTLDGRVLRFSLSKKCMKSVRHSSCTRPLWTARAGGAVKASLAADGDRVIVGDYAGKVTAFARRDGRVVWQTTSPGPRLRGAGRFYAGPSVAYGRVYLGNVNGYMLALEAATGRVAWVRVTDDFIYSSAAVARRTVYVGNYDQHLYALDAVTGRVKWKFDAGERISGSPSVIGDLVWFSTLAREPRQGVTIALDARTGREVTRIRDGRYTPAVAVKDLLVVTGVRTLYGLQPTSTTP